MARQMIAEVRDHYGLGVGLQGSGTALRFGHGGRDEGFDAQLDAYAETGQGVAIMINANDNSGMVSRIIEVIAREYHWPDYPLPKPSKRAAAGVAEEELIAYTGRYEFTNNRMLTLAVERGRLGTMVDGLPDEEFLPETADRFHSAQRDLEVAFLRDGGGEVSGMLWKQGGRERKVPRIGPLFHTLKPCTDPDPARTDRVVAVLRALGQGGKSLADSRWITPGAREDLGNGSAMDLAGLKSLVFLAERDVSSREIERHKGKVGRVLHYRLVTDKADRGLLIHLTPDGLITDYDIVED
jgi:hypothetical protein